MLPPTLFAIVSTRSLRIYRLTNFASEVVLPAICPDISFVSGDTVRSYPSGTASFSFTLYVVPGVRLVNAYSYALFSAFHTSPSAFSFSSFVSVFPSGFVSAQVKERFFNTSCNASGLSSNPVMAFEIFKLPGCTFMTGFL